MKLMKKYYCPYCGEQTLSSYQKYIRKYGRWQSLQTALYFTCSSCHNEIEKEETPRGKKYRKILFPIFAISCVAFLLVTCLQSSSWWIFVPFVAICVVSMLITILCGGNCVFVRTETKPSDIWYGVELDAKGIVSGGIYLLKPPVSEIEKASVKREYIAELRQDEAGGWAARVIKPQDSGFAPITFRIYDDVCVGEGWLRGQP